MAFAQKILPHYTYEDWLHWEGRWELIEGIPIAMSPTPLPRHQRCAALIRWEFETALRKSGCKKCLTYDPVDYKITDDTILVPDVLIVCGKIAKKYLDFAPALVAEILSPSTALRDRNTKYELYQQQGVKYYLIVDPDKEIAEVYELINGQYLEQPHGKSFSFVFENDCQADVNISGIWEN